MNRAGTRILHRAIRRIQLSVFRQVAPTRSARPASLVTHKRAAESGARLRRWSGAAVQRWRLTAQPRPQPRPRQRRCACLFFRGSVCSGRFARESLPGVSGAVSANSLPAVRRPAVAPASAGGRPYSISASSLETADTGRKARILLPRKTPIFSPLGAPALLANFLPGVGNGHRGHGSPHRVT